MTTLIGLNTSAIDSTLNTGKTFAIGNRHQDHSGNTWAYVFASVAFTLGDCVAIKSNYHAAPMTDALSKTTGEVGFAQVAVTIDNYAWVMTNGRPTYVRVAIDCEPHVPLYITGTAGVLDDATLSSMIAGVQINTSATAAGAYAGRLSFPSVRWGASLSQI